MTTGWFSDLRLEGDQTPRRPSCRFSFGSVTWIKARRSRRAEGDEPGGWLGESIPRRNHKSDRNLQKLIEAELERGRRINATEVGVAVDKGVVTLTGAVGTYYEKLNAERAAMRVKGVRGLAEEIVVRPFGDIGSSDDEVAKRALSSLEWDVVVPNKSVQVRVEKGAVTLTGEVDWDFQRDAAERSVRCCQTKLHNPLRAGRLGHGHGQIHQPISLF
jgi:osmotically-inducible protein OsmY